MQKNNTNFICTLILLCACFFCCCITGMAQTDPAENKQDSAVSSSKTKSKKEKSGRGKAYKIISKSGNINNIQVAQKGGTSGEVKVTVVRMNKKINITNLEIKTENGNFYAENFTVTHFPVQATIQFQAPSATGFGSSMEQFNCKLSLSETGIWEIRINLTNI